MPEDYETACDSENLQADFFVSEAPEQFIRWPDAPVGRGPGLGWGTQLPSASGHGPHGHEWGPCLVFSPLMDPS